MADAATTLYGMVKPEVGASADTWGGKLNTDFDDLDALLGAITTTGSANAYVLTTGLSLAAYVNGQSFWIRASFANTGAATLNVDGIGAKNLRKNVAGTLTALATGDIYTGDYLRATYNSASDVIVIAGIGNAQPLDATLTALAALSWSSGAPLIQFTAADTVSLTLTPSVTKITTGAGTTSAVAVQIGTQQDGFVQNSAGNLGVVANGTMYYSLTTAFASFSNPLRLPAGSVGTVALCIRTADTDTGFYSIGTDNWGYAITGVKYMDWSTSLFQFVAPVQAPLAVSSETSGTLTVASANKQVNASGGITINDGVFAADTWVFIENYSGSSITITEDTGMTLRLHGTATTGNRTLAAYGGAAIRFKTNATAIVYGDVT